MVSVSWYAIIRLLNVPSVNILQEPILGLHGRSFFNGWSICFHYVFHIWSLDSKRHSYVRFYYLERLYAECLHKTIWESTSLSFRASFGGLLLWFLKSLKNRKEKNQGLISWIGSWRKWGSFLIESEEEIREKCLVSKILWTCRSYFWDFSGLYPSNSPRRRQFLAPISSLSLHIIWKACFHSGLSYNYSSVLIGSE